MRNFTIGLKNRIFFSKIDVIPLFIKYNKQEYLIKDAVHQKIWQVIDMVLLFIVLNNQADKINPISK